MCSFIVTTKDIDNIDLINKFTKLRGPDYTNIVKSHNFNIIHNLLSITGDFKIQPFIEDNIVCVYNGEIYNYKDFGDFKSDGECLIPLYKKYGDTFVKKLDGEFAICLLDFNKNEIITSTDVFATKPLWVNNTNDNFSMSIYESPLKRLSCENNIKVNANTCTIYDLISYKIKKTFNIFDFDLSQHKTSFKDWNTSFENSIIKRTKNNREKLFIGLSSGYDSGAIACSLLKNNVNFKAYSVQGAENINVLNQRHLLVNKNNLAVMTPYSHGNKLRTISHEYILKNVENFKYTIHSSSSDYNEYYLNIHDDNGSNGLSYISSLAKNDEYKIYLSGQGADEIFSDYGFNGVKKYPHSNFGGLFPKDLKTMFPWASYYGSSMESYLMKEESVAGSYGLEARYPYLDPMVVQEFLWLKSELKNENYKSVIHNYLKTNNFPFCVGEKIGF